VQEPEPLVIAKSPVVAILLNNTVTVSWLVTVTTFAADFVPTANLPNVRLVGETLSPLPPLVVTVRLSVVVCERLPDTPVMVIVTVPVAAVALAVSVSVLLVVVGFGLNPAVTPLGKPEALKVTLPVKPLVGLTVMVLVPLLPCCTVTLVGDADRVKFCAPA
jgi:hypothetical protein